MASSKDANQKGGGKDVLSFTAHAFFSGFFILQEKGIRYCNIDEMGAMYGRNKRSLIRDSNASEQHPISLKRNYREPYGITNRQLKAN
ncbi:MAG TPA: hypothetical protein VEI57_01560 [Nitrospirota bacterium]|nr:hypothetical protein [Nitrospirota bacterium]